MTNIINGDDGGATSRIRYTLDQLKSIGDTFLSQRRPDCYFNTNFSFMVTPWKNTQQPNRKNDKKSGKDNRESRDGPKEKRIGSGRIVERDGQWDKTSEASSGTHLNVGGTSDGRRKRTNPNDFQERTRNFPSMFDTMKARGAIRRDQQQYEGNPEWLHAGPTSKFDTIELHGFDEAIQEEMEEAKRSGDFAPTNSCMKDHREQTGHIDFDQFIQGGAHYSGANGYKPRSTQWFPKGAPHYQRAPDYSANRNYSIFNDFDNINDPNGNFKHSTPIYSTHSNEVPKNVKDFLQKANLAGVGEKRNDKLIFVKDIEASLRDCAEKPPNDTSRKDAPEMNVFKEFVATMPNEQLGAKAPASPLFADERNKLFTDMRFTRPTFLSYVELLQKIIHYGATQPNRYKFLNSRDGQEYLQALMRGEMSVFNLLHHIRNLRPGRDQEVIIAVLYAFNQASQVLQTTTFGQPPFARNPFDNMSNYNMFPTHNQATSSAGKHQRFPSPHELHLHTQTIMQNARMRKKIEEQLEHLAKGPYEMRQQTSHFPFGFTPTAVLGKMATDKDAEVAAKESSEASSI